MPLPAAAIPALISAGGSILGSGINAATQGNLNAKNMQFQLQMYELQRKHALEDWNMNAYFNSPQMQMQRLKAAGLNPHLVYGNGADAQVGGQVRQSDATAPATRAPQVDFSGIENAAMMYHDARLKEVQHDNVKAATQLAVQQALQSATQTANIAAQTAKTQTDTELGKFNLRMAQQLESTSLEKARLEVQKIGTDIEATKTGIKKTEADTAYTLQQKELTALTTAQSLQKGVEEILMIRAQRAKTEDERQKIQQEIRNLRASNTLDQLEIMMRRKGVSFRDGAGVRLVSDLLGGFEQHNKNVRSNAEKIINELKRIVNSSGSHYQKSSGTLQR